LASRAALENLAKFIHAVARFPERHRLSPERALREQERMSQNCARSPCVPSKHGSHPFCSKHSPKQTAACSYSPAAMCESPSASTCGEQARRCND
jgi:hypothetical protein